MNQACVPWEQTEQTGGLLFLFTSSFHSSTPLHTLTLDSALAHSPCTAPLANVGSCYHLILGLKKGTFGHVVKGAATLEAQECPDLPPSHYQLPPLPWLHSKCLETIAAAPANSDLLRHPVEETFCYSLAGITLEGADQKKHGTTTNEPKCVLRLCMEYERTCCKRVRIEQHSVLEAKLIPPNIRTTLKTRKVDHEDR